MLIIQIALGILLGFILIIFLPNFIKFFQYLYYEYIYDYRLIFLGIGIYILLVVLSFFGLMHFKSNDKVVMDNLFLFSFLFPLVLIIIAPLAMYTNEIDKFVYEKIFKTKIFIILISILFFVGFFIFLGDLVNNI